MNTRPALFPLLLVALASHAVAGEKPAVTWHPAAASHQRANRGAQIDRIVIHTVEGSLMSAVNTFRSDPRKVSAHYIVGRGGAIAQCVQDRAAAYHCGRWNGRSIGIEHEGFAGRPATWTDALMRSSARLTRWLCDTYRIPIDRTHIVGHKEVPGATHGDPGRYFDWDRYLRLVRGAGTNLPPAAAGDPPADATATADSTTPALTARTDTQTSGSPASTSGSGSRPTAADATAPAATTRGSSTPASAARGGSTTPTPASATRGAGGSTPASARREQTDGATRQEAADRRREAGALDPKTLDALAELDRALEDHGHAHEEAHADALKAANAGGGVAVIASDRAAPVDSPADRQRPGGLGGQSPPSIDPTTGKPTGGMSGALDLLQGRRPQGGSVSTSTTTTMPGGAVRTTTTTTTTPTTTGVTPRGRP